LKLKKGGHSSLKQADPESQRLSATKPPDAGRQSVNLRRKAHILTRTNLPDYFNGPDSVPNAGSCIRPDSGALFVRIRTDMARFSYSVE
jgi:hypothetical protein